MVNAMPARKKPEVQQPPPPPSTEGLGREWKDRKEVYKSIAIYRDIGDWATELAADQDTTVAAYLDGRLRMWLWNEYRAMLARKTRAAEGEQPPPAPK